MKRKNKLLIPLVAIAICGTLGIGTFSGLFVIRQNQYNELRNGFNTLTTNFENLTSNFNNVSIVLDGTLSELEAQLLEYQILFGDNEDLQDEIDSLTNDLSELESAFQNLNNLYLELQDNFNDLTDNHTILQTSYSDLQDDFNNLTIFYDDLYILHSSLVNTYLGLLDDYYILLSLQQTTQNSLDMFLDMIINEIPMAQKMAFYYQFVRNYIEESLDFWDWTYQNMLRIQEKIILHSSGQLEDAFLEVDTILESYNFFEWDSYRDAWYTMVYVYGANSEGGFVPDEFFMAQATLQMVQSWMTNNLHYIYDSDTEWEKEWSLDFMQSPLETMMYCGGDCEDWTIFASTFFEVTGYQTAVASVHDDSHGTFGSLHHSFLFVKVGYGNYGAPHYWKLDPSENRFDWIPVDTLWCDTIGEVPSWLQWYYDFGDATWIDDHIRWEIVDGIFD